MPAFVEWLSAAGAGSKARVATASGALTLEQAFNQHLIQLIHNGGRSIIVTDDHHPVTLDLSGSGLALKVRSLTSAGEGVAKGSGPARYYGPPRVYRKPLHLTARQLKRLRFASVDRFGRGSPPNEPTFRAERPVQRILIDLD